MPFELHITDEGTPQIVGRLLEASGEQTLDMASTMEAIYYEMLYANLKQIDSGGRRGGGSYANLTENTVKKKGTGDILYTMGARPKYTKFGDDTLVRSVTQPDGPMQVKTVTNTTVIIGTDRPYAGAHQYGAPKRGIPRRPFLNITKGDREKYGDMIARKLMEPLMEK